MKLVKENWRLILLGVCACACTFLVNLARPYQKIGRASCRERV